MEVVILPVIFNTNEKLIIGNSKHDFKRNFNNKQLILKIVKKLSALHNIFSLQDIVIYKCSSNPKIHGFIKKSIINNLPSTILNISDSTILDLLAPQCYDYAYHIIHHEICHIQDFETICKYMDGNLVSDNYQAEYNLKAFYFVNGYKFFGEYIAYRNCFSSYAERSPDYDKLPHKIKTDSTIQRLLNTYDKDFKYRNIMFSKTMEDINNTIYFLCKQIGYYHASQNKSFIENLDLTKSELFICYIDKLNQELDNLYSTYPSWISYEKYIEIGKLFYSIFGEFKIGLCEYGGDICFDF